MTNLPDNIAGGNFFMVDGGLCFSVGSREIYQSDLEKISEEKSLSKVLFYYISFRSVDFSSFLDSAVIQFSFLHGNFSDRELEQVCHIPSVRCIQILDTLVTSDHLLKLKSQYQSIEFK